MPKKTYSPFIKITLIGLIMLFSIRQTSNVLASFIGPNRTVTEIVQEGDGWGRECQLVGGSYRWVTTTTCSGCSTSCVNQLKSQYPDSNPASICNASYLGSKVHDYSCTEVERDVTYQPAAISAVTSCAQPGSSGWCRSDAVVNLDGSEGVDACGKYSLTLFEDNQANSAPASGCSAAASFIITANGVTDYRAWVHSSLGDTSAMTSQTILVDKTPPTLSYSQPDLFTLALSGTDAHSGIDRFEVNINGGGWVAGAAHPLLPGVNDIQMRVFDIAGNVTTDRVTILTDNTPPETLFDAISPSTPDGERGWYLTAPTITVTAADSQTGIAFAGVVLDGVDHSAAAGYSVGEGVHTVQIKAVDGAGNQRVEAPVSFQNPLKVDTVLPVLDLGISPAPVIGDWYDESVVVDASDSYDAGSGLDAVAINLDEAGFLSGPTITLDEGKHTMVVQASDLAGNTVSQSHVINVDLNPPYATPTASGQKGPGLADLPWFSSPVSVEANAGDAAGGPVSVEYSLNGSAYQDGGVVPVDQSGMHDLTFRVTDPVGRTAVEGISFGIDTQAPILSITSHAKGAVVKGALHLSGEAFDGLSGINRIELKVGQGGWNEYAPRVLEAAAGEADWSFDLSLEGFDGGPLALFVRAQDNAGNYSSEQRISLLVNNRSARLEIPDRWLVGQTIIPRHVRGDTGGVVKAVAVISHPRYGSQSIPLRSSNDWAIRWKGIFESKRIWAPPGEYTIIVTSWDQYGNSASDRGVIVVPLPEDGPTQIPPQRFEVYGIVTALSGEGVTIDNASYQITSGSVIADGVTEGVLVYGEAEKANSQTSILWLKLAREISIHGLVEEISPESLQVAGERYELTSESRLPGGLAEDVLVSGVGLEDGRGDPDVLWLELIAKEPLPFSGVVSSYESNKALTVEGAVYFLNEETQISTQSGLEVGDAVTGWYLEDGFLALSVLEIEPEVVSFEGTVVDRTGSALFVDAAVYNLVEESILPEEIAAGHLVLGSAYVFEDGHFELIEASIIPGEIAGVVTGIKGPGQGGGYTVYINNVPFQVYGELPQLREGQEITGWVDAYGELTRLRVVSRLPVGFYSLAGLVLVILLWWLFGRSFIGTVVAVEEDQRRFTLRLNEDLENPQMRTVGYHKRLESSVRLNRGRLVRGRILLFRAWTMKEKEAKNNP